MQKGSYRDRNEGELHRETREYGVECRKGDKMEAGIMVSWKKLDKVIKGYASAEGITEQINVPIDIYTKSISEAMNEPVDNYVENVSKYCDYCKNFNTVIPNGNLLKYMDKRFVKIVQEAINRIEEDIFTVNDLIDELGLKDLSDGDLQRKALTILVCNGYLKKTIKEIEVKGKLKPKYIFEKVKGMPQIPKCMVHENNKLKHKNPEWIERIYFGVHAENDNE